MLLVLFALLPGPGRAWAQVLLFPNGGQIPGEGAVHMGGAQTALAAGGSAVWHNPAGLARERGGQVALGVQPVAWVQQHGEVADRAAVRTTFDHAVVSGGPLGRRADPRFGWGVFLAQPLQHEFTTALAERRVARQADLPSPLLGPDGLDALFPAGFQREQTASGVGTLAEVAPGVGFGVALLPWFRVGATWTFSRVSMLQQGETLVRFTGDSNPATDNTLVALTHTTARYEGTVERTTVSVGLQVDLGRVVLLGLAVKLPSQTVAGRGRVRVVRSRALEQTQDGALLVDNSDFAVVEADGLTFDLRTPRETRLGIAVVGERMILAVDLIQRGALGPYTVFPSLRSGATSPASLQLEPLQTSLEVVTDLVAGLAFTVSETETVLFGVAGDRSGVPGTDPVFRRVHFQTLSMGYNHARDGASYTLGFTYRFSDGTVARFPTLGGGEPFFQRVELEIFALGAGVAWGF